MTDSSMKMVAAFHKAFGIENRQQPGLPESPVMDGLSDDYNGHLLMAYANRMTVVGKDLHKSAKLHEDKLLLRLQLIQEELGELAEGMADGDLVACLDALCDLRYVIDGCVLSLGLQGVFDEAFAEVHRSNMSKLNSVGNPILDEAGRVVKSESYSPPDLDRLLQ